MTEDEAEEEEEEDATWTETKEAITTMVKGNESAQKETYKAMGKKVKEKYPNPHTLYGYRYELLCAIEDGFPDDERRALKIGRHPAPKKTEHPLSEAQKKHNQVCVQQGQETGISRLLKPFFDLSVIQVCDKAKKKAYQYFTRIFRYAYEKDWTFNYGPARNRKSKKGTTSSLGALGGLVGGHGDGNSGHDDDEEPEGGNSGHGDNGGPPEGGTGSIGNQGDGAAAEEHGEAPAEGEGGGISSTSTSGSGASSAAADEHEEEAAAAGEEGRSTTSSTCGASAESGNSSSLLGSARSSKTPCIYVLKLKNGRYYVGKTRNTTGRQHGHMGGKKGSAWTARHTPTGEPPTFTEATPKETSGFQEDIETLRMMELHGIDRVRGGSFSSPTLSDSDIRVITKMINHNKTACFTCGEKGHWTYQCPSRSKDDGEVVRSKKKRKTGTKNDEQG